MMPVAESCTSPRPVSHTEGQCLPRRQDWQSLLKVASCFGIVGSTTVELRSAEPLQTRRMSADASSEKSWLGGSQPVRRNLEPCIAEPSMQCIQIPAQTIVRGCHAIEASWAWETHFNDNPQEVCCDISCSLGEEHLEGHHPESPVGRTFSCLRPFEVS